MGPARCCAGPFCCRKVSNPDDSYSCRDRGHPTRGGTVRLQIVDPVGRVSRIVAFLRVGYPRRAEVCGYRCGSTPSPTVRPCWMMNVATRIGLLAFDFPLVGSGDLFARSHRAAVAGVEDLDDDVAVLVTAQRCQAWGARNDVVGRVTGERIVGHGVAPVCGNNIRAGL